MWESPLKAGKIVRCTNGLRVRVLQDPVWDTLQERYNVEVEVLDSGNSTVDTGRDNLKHIRPDRFVRSIFDTIEDPVPTLEEEFFSRGGQKWASST